jgi:hypothetical protein
MKKKLKKIIQMKKTINKIIPLLYNNHKNTNKKIIYYGALDRQFRIIFDNLIFIKHNNTLIFK